MGISQSVICIIAAFGYYEWQTSCEEFIQTLFLVTPSRCSR
jgi:hypothetical protein